MASAVDSRSAQPRVPLPLLSVVAAGGAALGAFGAALLASAGKPSAVPGCVNIVHFDTFEEAEAAKAVRA